MFFKTGLAAHTKKVRKSCTQIIHQKSLPAPIKIWWRGFHITALKREIEMQHNYCNLWDILKPYSDFIGIRCIVWLDDGLNKHSAVFKTKLPGNWQICYVHPGCAEIFGGRINDIDATAYSALIQECGGGNEPWLRLGFEGPASEFEKLSCEKLPDGCFLTILLVIIRPATAGLEPI